MFEVWRLAPAGALRIPNPPVQAPGDCHGLLEIPSEGGVALRLPPRSKAPAALLGIPRHFHLRSFAFICGPPESSRKKCVAE